MRKTWGERNYPEERLALFWNAFKDVADDILVSAVDNLIANERYAPMADKLDEAVQAAKVRANSSRRSGNPFKNVLSGIPEFGRDQDLKQLEKRLLESLWAKKITLEEFKRDMDQVIKLATQVDNSRKIKRCEHCAESGLVHPWVNGNECVYRCDCEFGKMHAHNPILPVWRGKTETKTSSGKDAAAGEKP